MELLGKLLIFGAIYLSREYPRPYRGTGNWVCDLITSPPTRLPRRDEY